MKRSVLLTIDDERVTHVGVKHLLHEDGSWIRHQDYVPVPPGDQLTQDLDALTSFGVFIPTSLGWTPEEVNAMKARVRAALGLDES